MGCASSKSKQKRCKHCSNPYSPVTRSYSLHIHHPPSIEGESYHLVALSSTTLGSIPLDDHSSNPNQDDTFFDDPAADDDEKVEFEVGMIEAKSWSKMIDEKITKVAPKTPIRTPPGEPETINAWEMMEGLEDTSPLIRPVSHHGRSFSFHVFPDEAPDPKPFWKETPEKAKTAVMSEFDPEIISAFRKALEELSPNHPFRLSKTPTRNPQPDDDDDDVKVIQVVGMEEKESVNERLVLYFTSLRGVRKTYEDCCNVRMILKGMGVRVDERDVSMHLGFKEELRELLGDGFGGGLPRVFVGGNYIGGAEEIRRLHEEGSLEKALERCEFFSGSCEACGDVRFVPCEACSGSCKIYHEEDEEDEDEDDEGELGFQKCPHCNENGLIRCPICCY